MSLSLEENDLKFDLMCSLYLSLAIIMSDFFEDINEYCACPKLYYHSLNVKVLPY